MSRFANVLITGGNGLVGSALREIFPEALYTNRHDADLTDLCQVRKLFKKFRPRKVIHLAAKVAGVKTNAEKNADMFTLNTQINTNVLETAKEFKVKKLVAVLSNCVFQVNPPHPPTENQIHLNTPYQGHLGYGYAKRMLDIQIHLLRQQYGCNFTSITPVTIFGPNDNWNFNDSHVVGSLIHKCYLAKKNKTALEVWGSGKAVRQFVFSKDVARILLKVLDEHDQPETIIIAADEGFTIARLTKIVTKVMDFKGPIHFDTTKPEGELVRVLNNGKFKALFPNFHFVPLEKALRSTAQWFLANIENLNKMEKAGI